MKNWINKNRNNIIIFTIYSIITFTLIFFHEAWRDEAQAWLIARDLNLIELYEQMKWEGHFLLWYLILMPFAKLGFPYITTNIISWLTTSISVWLILKKAPFKTYKKVLIIFTFPMIYLFPIISRCYCLISLAIVLLAIFYKDREVKPIRYILAIILLANTHVIMLGMVGILLLEFYIEQSKNNKLNFKKENREIVISIIISIVLIILSIIPLMGSLTTNQDVGIARNITAKVIETLIIQPFIMIINIYYTFGKNNFVILLVTILIKLLCFYELIYHKKEIFRILPIFLWQYFIYAFIFTSSPQKAGTAILIILFFSWIREYNTKPIVKEIEQKIINIALIILLIINIIGGIIYIAYDICFDYSTAHKVGKYINENVEEGSIIITADRSEFCSSIVPYVKNVKFYHIQSERYITFAILDESNNKAFDVNFLEKAKAEFGSADNLYYLYSKEKIYESPNEDEAIKELENKNILIKVFETGSDIWAGEEYIVYKLNFI